MLKTMQIAHAEHGDQEHTFDTADEAATAEARALFDKLTGGAGVAFNISAQGETQGRVAAFDDLAERSILIPKYAGG